MRTHYTYNGSHPTSRASLPSLTRIPNERAHAWVTLQPCGPSFVFVFRSTPLRGLGLSCFVDNTCAALPVMLPPPTAPTHNGSQPPRRPRKGQRGKGERGQGGASATCVRDIPASAPTHLCRLRSVRPRPLLVHRPLLTNAHERRKRIAVRVHASTSTRSEWSGVGSAPTLGGSIRRSAARREPPDGRRLRDESQRDAAVTSTV